MASDKTAGSSGGGGNRSKGGSKKSQAANRKPKLDMSKYSQQALGTPF